MKKKHLSYLIVVLTIVVICSVLAAIIILSQAQKKKDMQVVEHQLHSFFEQADKIAASAPDDSANNIGEFVYSRMTCEVISVTKDSCTLQVSAPSLYQVFHEIYDPNIYGVATDAESYNVIIEEILGDIFSTLTSGEYEMVTADVVVLLDSDGNIQMTRELIDAMYGGLLTLQDEIAKQFFEEMGK